MPVNSEVGGLPVVDHVIFGCGPLALAVAALCQAPAARSGAARRSPRQGSCPRRPESGRRWVCAGPTRRAHTQPGPVAVARASIRRLPGIETTQSVAVAHRVNCNLLLMLVRVPIRRVQYSLPRRHLQDSVLARVAGEFGPCAGQPEARRPERIDEVDGGWFR